MGETQRALEQLYKILPITHEAISTTPFVKPKSYVENREKGLDGESMSDWFTGSGCVLVKVLLWYVFGIRADLNGVSVGPCANVPFERIHITLKVKGVAVDLTYEKTGEGERAFYVDGEEQACVYNEKTGVKEWRFQTADYAASGLRLRITE